jgi:NDP-sugar pyrophosphorylase family protein
MKLDVLILAAGIGKRLYPYTKKLPKPLIQINQKPIIAYNLCLLEEYKSFIKNVNVVIGYKGKLIKDWLFSLNTNLPINIINQPPPYTNILKAILSAENVITTDKFLVIHADNLLINKNINDLLKASITDDFIFLLKKESQNELLKNQTTSIISINKNGYMVINHKTKERENFSIGGYYILSYKIFDIIKKFPDSKNLGLLTLIEELILNSYKPKGIITQDLCLNINTKAELDFAKSYLNIL